MWSKGAAPPAQHVAHNGLGRLVSRPLFVPPFLLCFFTTLSTPNREVNILRFWDSLLTLVTKVHMALISNAHQKKKHIKRKIKTRERRT